MSPASRIHLATAKFLAVLAMLLFASAGTLRFWQAWVHLGLQALGMIGTNLCLIRHDPALLQRRLKIDEGGETDPIQRRVMARSRALGALTLVIVGLDRRFGWSHVPISAVVVASIVFSIGTVVVLLVFRHNTYTSSVIEVDAGQTVVSTGPYALVRHPMYTGTLLMGLAMPIALGSLYAELVMPLAIALLVMRILAEERFLADRLQGYAEYLRGTRARLLPGVW